MKRETQPARLLEVGQRLAAERERLGLTQVALCERIQLTREMWSRYERGHSAISRGALAKFAVLGADTEFIQTGLRNPAAPPTEQTIQNALATLQAALACQPMTDEEREMLTGFRIATPEQRAMLLGYIRSLRLVA